MFIVRWTSDDLKVVNRRFEKTALEQMLLSTFPRNLAVATKWKKKQTRLLVERSRLNAIFIWEKASGSAFLMISHLMLQKPVRSLDTSYSDADSSFVVECATATNAAFIARQASREHTPHLKAFEDDDHGAATA